MVSIWPACRRSSVFSCAGSKSTTPASRSYSGFRLLTDPANPHRPTKRTLGNIVQALVERTFGWMTRWRSLVRDYEKRIDVSHAMILVAMGGNFIRRNAHP